MESTMLSMPSSWGLAFGAISFYYDLIFKGRVSLTLDYYCYQKGAFQAQSTCEFIIVAKFGDHVLCCLASSLSNAIRQAGRQADENFSLGDFF